MLVPVMYNSIVERVSLRGGMMGKEDICLKSYLASAKRYADLWNGAVFDGNQVIRAEELEEVNSLLDKADESVVLERERDLVMRQSRKGQRLAVWVVENQKTIDYSMPIRIMLQEALEYDRQVKVLHCKNAELNVARKSSNERIYKDAGERLYGIRGKDKLYPVITLVVYWGENTWKGPRNLHDMIGFEEFSEEEAERIRMFIPQYPLHILDLSSFERTENFTSELKHLFALYKRRNDKDAFYRYINENEQNWNMNDESWLVLSNLTHSKKLHKLIVQKELEETEMCKALDDLVDDAKAEGKAELLLDILSEYGEVDADLRQKIMEQMDSCVLKQWIKIAVTAENIEAFLAQIHI